MARFVNDTTKVVVSVDDSKADRFTAGGWTALEDGQYEADGDAQKPARRTRKTASKSDDN